MSMRRSPEGRRPADPNTDASKQHSAKRPSGRSGARFRIAIFAALCIVCVGIAGGSVLLARLRVDNLARGAAVEPTASLTSVKAVQDRPHLVFLQTQGDANRQVGLINLDVQNEQRSVTTLRCQRVYMAAGQGLCLGQTMWGGAFTFGADFQPRHVLSISGIPSRVRVSPDGRYGAMTVFVSGHSYSSGSFSTQTVLVDMAAGTILGDGLNNGTTAPLGLERLKIYRNGTRFEPQDRNLWGVTFAGDGHRFYATLGSGGTTHLIEGDVMSDEARIITENVECPSVSPDGTRLAFKKRVGGIVGSGVDPVIWRPYLLDLATLTESSLAETRNVDDQIEWLDDRNILYSLQNEGPPATTRPDIWQLTLDGSAPRLVMTGAMSPAVVR